jgi:hypothetical protein
LTAGYPHQQRKYHPVWLQALFIPRVKLNIQDSNSLL